MMVVAAPRRQTTGGFQGREHEAFARMGRLRVPLASM